jgi:hypothetical protein
MKQMIKRGQSRKRKNLVCKLYVHITMRKTTQYASFSGK